MVASDEVRELRLQIDKLRERLDWMAPRLLLLQRMDDYVQRVECEASVQLLRLKNARLSTPTQRDLQKEDPNSVETAKWLHTLTDLVINCITGDGDSFSPASPSQTTKRERRQQQQEQQQQLLAGQTSQTSNRSTTNEDGASSTVSSGSRSTTGSNRRERTQQQQMMPGVSAPELRPARETKRESRRQQQQQGGDFVESAIFNARPSSTAAMGEIDVDNNLTRRGLVLGKGTWANAYRQATGLRRDALRLLCSTGIVTERELADDLTVISEEHVEECVTIAREMLQKWTPELGPPPQQEAKAFFEEKLAAMYMKRAPAPFG